MSDALSTELEAEIGRLDTGIRQLKIQYDMFFAGAIPRQPLELRRDVEQLIKRYSTQPISKYALRFHFNSLVSRFNSLSELWAKTIRGQEEGDRPLPGATARPANGEEVFARLTVVNGARDESELRLLHHRLMEARKRSGETGHVSFEKFVRTVDAQAVKLREKTGCGKVELRVIFQGRKAVLKARPTG